jgi:hypothetical protein
MVDGCAKYLWFILGRIKVSASAGSTTNSKRLPDASPKLSKVPSFQHVFDSNRFFRNVYDFFISWKMQKAFENQTFFARSVCQKKSFLHPGEDQTDYSTRLNTLMRNFRFDARQNFWENNPERAHTGTDKTLSRLTRKVCIVLPLHPYSSIPHRFLCIFVTTLPS